MKPDIQNQMTPDEAAASLAFSTNLLEGLMRSRNHQMGMEGEMMGEMSPESPQMSPQTPPERPQEAPGTSQALGVEEITELVKNAVKEELSGLREEIKQALNEED